VPVFNKQYGVSSIWSTSRQNEFEREIERLNGRLDMEDERGMGKYRREGTKKAERKTDTRRSKAKQRGDFALFSCSHHSSHKRAQYTTEI
jgi:hypothetical protein